MRTLAIGDIHGCHASLKALVECVDFRPDDVIVTLGDYVDRGPGSKEVIDFLIELGKSHNLITLKGNHEVMMENARYSEQERYFWLLNGGDATMSSFYVFNPERIHKVIPKEYWDFMDSCSRYYETDTHILVHAGLEAETDLDEQDDNHILWQRVYETEPHKSGKTIVCGHTPQTDGDPLVLDHAVCIDTFACRGGWLTCLDLESGDYWQANEKEETRNGTLDSIVSLNA